MPKTSHDTSLEHFARELRERRGYMAERAPSVSVRERWFHVAVIGAIVAALLVGKVVASVPPLANALPGDEAAGAVTSLTATLSDH